MEVKLKFFYGAMGCGKTRKMQGDYYSKIEDGFNAIIIKPGIDKKADGDTLARDGSKIKAEFLIGKEDNIYDIIAEYLIDNNLDFIFVDEPISHLDDVNGEIMGRIVTEEAHRQGAGVIVTSIGKRLEITYDKILKL